MEIDSSQQIEPSNFLTPSGIAETSDNNLNKRLFGDINSSPIKLNLFNEEGYLIGMVDNKDDLGLKALDNEISRLKRNISIIITNEKNYKIKKKSIKDYLMMKYPKVGKAESIQRFSRWGPQDSNKYNDYDAILSGYIK